MQYGHGRCKGNMHFYDFRLASLGSKSSHDVSPRKSRRSTTRNNVSGNRHRRTRGTTTQAHPAFERREIKRHEQETALRQKRILYPQSDTVRDGWVFSPAAPPRPPCAERSLQTHPNTSTRAAFPTTRHKSSAKWVIFAGPRTSLLEMLVCHAWVLELLALRATRRRAGRFISCTSTSGRIQQGKKRIRCFARREQLVLTPPWLSYIL